VIDPLVYSTYIGGSWDDEGYGIAVDGSGHAYVTGQTYSTDYDVTPGAFQTTYRGWSDVFVTKLNAAGPQNTTDPHSETLCIELALCE
jgi:hypothetical protein